MGDEASDHRECPEHGDTLTYMGVYEQGIWLICCVGDCKYEAWAPGDE